MDFRLKDFVIPIQLAIALGKDFKEKLSVVIYVVAIPLAFLNSCFACVLCILIAVTWFIRDRRIEKTLIS